MGTGKHMKVTPEGGYAQAEQNKLNAQSWQWNRYVQGRLVVHGEGWVSQTGSMITDLLLFLNTLRGKIYKGL